MKTGIYMIRNKVNNKAYIGQAVDIDFRWATHISELNNNKHSNQYLQNSWNKYGEDNFEFTIICLCEEEELNEFEIDMIAHYDTYNNGYNLSLGGEGNRGYKFTDEQRAKVSEALKGKPKSEEHKAKISEFRKGRSTGPRSEKTKAKMSEARKGKPKSEEWKIKHSEARKGKGIKSVYCVTNDTVYASVSEAGEKLGIGPGNISWCCNGKNILPEYPDGHHKKKGRFKDSPVYEFWYLDEYEEKFGKVAM